MLFDKTVPLVRIFLQIHLGEAAVINTLMSTLLRVSTHCPGWLCVFRHNDPASSNLDPNMTICHMAGCTASMDQPRSNPKCWYGTILMSLLQEGSVDLSSPLFGRNFPFWSSLCLERSSLPYQLQHNLYCKVKFLWRIEETWASDRFFFQTPQNLPSGKGKVLQAGLPACCREGKQGRQRLTTSSICDLISLLRMCHQQLKVIRLPGSIPGSGSRPGEQPLCHLCLC